MNSTRRAFLAASSGSLLGLAGLDVRPATAASAGRASPAMYTTGCPFCAVGCGALVVVDQGKVRHIEGDPEHPINGGTLCAKGESMSQISDSPRRVTTVKYRAPGATAWEEKDWEWALATIAAKMQSARDGGFQTADAAGRRVNRTRAVASLGGATLTNEACYALSKLARALGLVFLAPQAGDGQQASLVALHATLGRAATTNHWIDLANADVILAIGCNVADNHPVAMKWIAEAQRRGAKLLSVDPRFTRTAAVADRHLALRAGTDLALIGGLIHHVLEQGLVDRAYLTAHTNASFLVDPAYTFDAGRFGSMKDGTYTREHWQFQRDAQGHIRQDLSLEDPCCVFQQLKRHFARYTWATVSQVCGTPVEQLRELADWFASTGRPERSGAIVFADGLTEHSQGTQSVRGLAILQLLLGNVGVAGGGLYALGGASNEQGACDHGLTSAWLPGHLPAPRADGEETAPLEPPLVSLLKAWWGNHAEAGNRFAFDYLPKHDGDGSLGALFKAIDQGEVQGLLVWGQNPAVRRPDLERSRRSLEKLRWLVVTDHWETETANFWKRPGAETEKIETEVFLLPAATWLEQAGSVTNAGRWAQWRAKIVESPGECRSELWIVDRLCRELKRRYAAGGVFADPIVQLTWDFGDPPDPHRVAQEINGRVLADVPATGRRLGLRPGDPVPSSTMLADDGSTSAGNWLYAGSYTTSNQMARRGLRRAEDTLGQCRDWAWAWPENRRVLCNRAGCDLTGRPWAETKGVVRYEESQERWTGDVPDGYWPPPLHENGSPHPQGKRAFPWLAEGRACLFTPALADGPLPEYYEPRESPVVNLLSPQQHGPLVTVAGDRLGTADKYPIVATTFTVAEHWQTGSTTRNLPWLVELMPVAFAELSRELARQKGIASGELITIRSARGEITVQAMVTNRLKPLEVAGKQLEQIAILWQFGYEGLATGHSANVLTSEGKAFLCDVRRAKQ